jgi:hypothetical protein
MALLGVSLAHSAGASETTAAQIARLRADLAGPDSATEILTRWCVARGQASPAIIKAVRVHGADRKPDAATRVTLRARAGETIRYRRVRLMCGAEVFSEADNWYLPDKLTAGMNDRLGHSDTPFGAVVRPLDFRRKTLSVREQAGAGTILKVRALLVDARGTPFSLVVEDYHSDLLAPVR